MKDIAERVFALLPGYVPDLIAMISRPKRTIAARNTGDDADLTRALVFVAVTVGIGFILQAPAIGPNADFLTLAAAMAAFKTIAIPAFAFVIWLAFRLFGGTGEYQRTLIAYIYMVSPLYLAGIVLTLIASGFVRAYDPELGLRLRTDPTLFVIAQDRFREFEEAAPSLAEGFRATNLASSALMVGWFLICLGAFRAVHGVSRVRSALAATLIMVAYWPFVIAITFLSYGMFGSLAPPLH